jgi:hypothetical protein
MKRSLPILALLAVVLTLVASWSIASRMATTTHQRQGLMFPSLATIGNDIRSVELLQGDRRVLLQRAEDGSWRLAERDGYPADVEQVRSLIAGLSQLERDQVLTRKRDRHQELNLAWPDPEGRARLIRLSTGGETPPIEMLLGQERISPRSTYARAFDEDQTWRCRGGVNADVDLQRWMRRDLLSLPPSEILGADWMGLRVVRRPDAPADARTLSPELFTATVPEGSAWTPAQAAATRGTLAEWPTRLEFDDVRAARSDFAPSADRTLAFELKGARLVLEGRTEGAQTWFQLRVEPRTGGSPPTAKPVPGDPWIPDWNAFADRVRPWEYRMPTWRASQLDRLRSDEPEPKMPDAPNMTRRDRLPPPSAPGP